MNREILRLNNIVKYHQDVALLDYFNLQLNQAEIMGVYCSNSPDKQCLMSILHGDQIPDAGRVFYKEKMLRAQEMSELRGKNIYFIDSVSNLIADLTVADNFFYIRRHAKKYFIPRQILIEQSQRLLNNFNIKNIKPEQYVSELSLLDRYRIELVKSQLIGCKIIVIDQMFDVLDDRAISEIRLVFDLLQKQKISIICFSGSSKLLLNMCDRITIMKNGHTRRLIERSEFSLHSLDTYFNEDYSEFTRDFYRQPVEIDEIMIRQKEEQEEIVNWFGDRINATFTSDFSEISFIIKEKNQKNILTELFSIKLLRNFLKQKENNEFWPITIGPFYLDKSKKISLLDSKRSFIIFLEHFLEDSESFQEFTMVLDGKSFVVKNNLDLHKLGIAYVPKDRVSRLYIEDLSPVQNLYLANMKKNNVLAIDRSRMRKHIWHSFDEWCESLDLSKTDLDYYKKFYLKIMIVFYRWVLFSPRLMLIASPYHALDGYGRKLIKSILKRIQKDSIPILIISSNIEEAYDLSENVQFIDQNIV